MLKKVKMKLPKKAFYLAKQNLICIWVILHIRAVMKVQKNGRKAVSVNSEEYKGEIHENF